MNESSDEEVINSDENSDEEILGCSISQRDTDNEQQCSDVGLLGKKRGMVYVEEGCSHSMEYAGYKTKRQNIKMSNCYFTFTRVK